MASIQSSVESLVLYASDRSELRPSSMGGNRYPQLTATFDPTTSILTLELGAVVWGPTRMKDLTEAYDYEVHRDAMPVFRDRLKFMMLNQVIKNPEIDDVQRYLTAWGLTGGSSFDDWFERYRWIAFLRINPLEDRTEADNSALATWEEILELETADALQAPTD